MVTRSRYRLPHGGDRCAAVQEADFAKALVFVEAVQHVTGDDAGLAPRASVEIDLNEYCSPTPGAVNGIRSR